MRWLPSLPIVIKSTLTTVTYQTTRKKRQYSPTFQKGEKHIAENYRPDSLIVLFHAKFSNTQFVHHIFGTT